MLKLVKEGYGCAFSYVGNEQAAEETLRQAEGIRTDARVRAYMLDVSDSDQVENVVEHAIADFENIDALINNAGIVRNNAAVMMTDEEWNRVIATNLTGPFLTIRAFLMHFLSNRRGRIINISSLAQDGSSGQVNYAASKAGLIGLTKSLARELAPRGVTVNAVAPGFIRTDMTDGLPQEAKDALLAGIPMGCLGEPADVAAAVLFLLGPGGRYITGQVLGVNGGMVMQG